MFFMRIGSLFWLLWQLRVFTLSLPFCYQRQGKFRVFILVIVFVCLLPLWQLLFVSVYQVHVDPFLCCCIVCLLSLTQVFTLCYARVGMF